MNDYNLKSDEVLLYSGNAYLIGDNNGRIEILLTNLNLVLISKTKKLFAKKETKISTYPMQDIKFFNDKPQIKNKDKHVELYFQNCEVIVNFNEKIDAWKFTSAATKLLTGKSIATRGAEKINGAVGVVDKALGIDTVDTVKNVLENGFAGGIIGGIRAKNLSKNNTSKIAKEALSVAKEYLNKDQSDYNSECITENSVQTIQNNSSDLDSQVESLKKLKELLDAGILTKEEFYSKKIQILNL